MSVFDSEAPTPPQEPKVDQAYLDFVKKHRDRCAQWARTHGNANFPILKLPDGSFIWLTREQRRRIEMGQRRHFKRQAKIAFLERMLEISRNL